MQFTELKSKLEEKIKALEEEKNLVVEEIKQLKEVVELSKRAKDLEDEVGKLKKEVETLKGQIPRELLQKLGVLASEVLGEAEKGERSEEEACSGYEEELF